MGESRSPQRAEATDSRALVIERVEPPLGFRAMHYEDLSGWAGEHDHRNLSRLLDVVGGFVNPRTDEKTGRLVQRLRWIEPGSFWMGSPADEPERWDKEGPRHLVTLSRGFWLADTACTQALWQRVMKDNRSRFKGPDRPVEQVSWEDVQRFLRALKAKLAGCAVAGLPTEAEWEYACRAGTETPFSFGAQVTPDQVNYDGNYPYAGGERGVDREETVPVKSLPPNAWGLYEMHGNVWEWCADGQRTYTDKPQVDPQGNPGEGDAARRAARGGSWINNARGVRSAYRYAFRPGHAAYILGFRVSLRSIEPGKSSSRPGGLAPEASGGRP